MNVIPQVRTGTTIIELLMALLLLGTAASIIGKTVPHLARQRQRTWQADVAREELCRQLEFLTRLDGERLSDAIRQLKISKATADHLTKAELTGKLIEDDPRFGKGSTAIQLQLRWAAPVGGAGRSAFLETWVFPD